MQPNQYETKDVDFAAFLLLEGIDFCGCVSHPNNPKVVLMRFNDPHNKCRDLQIVFLRSDYKAYRDIHKQLLVQIHETLRQAQSV